ncbi:MAG TPA: Rrf2 family transcriptional regulator [Dehalococcoidia bacterium]|nr:Rrf2 family transcriptional regulator [Dehalococcoidia bacterium]
MRLSTRARYGTRLLLELALQRGQQPIQLKDVAHNQQVSLLYLEHLIKPLIAAGIVKSRRGARGGIWLTRSPHEIKLGEIIRLLEGSTTPVDCVDIPESCPRSSSCVTRDVWSELKQAMNGVLDSITLQDLVERHKSKTAPSETVYQI